MICNKFNFYQHITYVSKGTLIDTLKFRYRFKKSVQGSTSMNILLMFQKVH